MNGTPKTDEEKLVTAVLRLNGRIVGIAFGLVGGFVIFVATNWLVMKGGDVIGPHLGLLNQYFFGYSVSFVGSFVGMAYGFVTGYVSGWIIARIYNRIVFFRERLKA